MKSILFLALSLVFSYAGASSPLDLTCSLDGKAALVLQEVGKLYDRPTFTLRILDSGVFKDLAAQLRAHGKFTDDYLGRNITVDTQNSQISISVLERAGFEDGHPRDNEMRIYLREYEFVDLVKLGDNWDLNFHGKFNSPKTPVPQSPSIANWVFGNCSR